MTEQREPQRAEGTGAPRIHERSASWRSVLAPAVALLAGLLIGGVSVSVADDDGPSTEPQPTESPTLGDVTESPAEEATAVVVPDACLAAVDTVEEATELARQGAGAIRDFEAERLRSLLSRLEVLDERAQEQAEACREAEVGQPPP